LSAQRKKQYRREENLLHNICLTDQQLLLHKLHIFQCKILL